MCNKKFARKFRKVINGLIAVLIFVSILAVWTISAGHNIRVAPSYEQVDLHPYLAKEKLTQEEYELLFRQTGLSKSAIDVLYQQDGQEAMLFVQERFFEEPEIEYECDFPIFRENIKCWKTEACGEEFCPEVEDGDILITFSSRFFGWRNGHAGIVTDAEKGLTVEALALGSDSDILSLDGWAERPTFALLRLKDVSAQSRSEIADYASENLTGVPYRLSAGVWDAPGTQCAHLVWSAYSRFGYDLDSDGGRIVTPKDLYESPMLEIVQIYGMDTDTILK